MKLAFEFKEVRSSKPESLPCSDTAAFSFIPSSWAPLADGSFKINYDAAFSKASTAVACIIQGGLGHLIDLFGKRISAHYALLDEAYAIRETLIFCLKASTSNVGIKNDCVNVISWCKFSGVDPP